MADVQSFTDGIDEEDERVAVSIILLCSVLKLRQLRKRRKRREWVSHWLQRREDQGLYHNLVRELQLQDGEDFRRFLRMNTDTFQVSMSMLLLRPERPKDLTRPL